MSNAPSPASLPTVEILTCRPAVRRGTDTLVTAVVRITAPEAPAHAERRRINIAFAIDMSGSMGGEKMEHARRAAIHAVDLLAAGDRVAVVAFDTAIETVVPSTVVGAHNRAAIAAAISRIQPRGGTDLHEGWRAAGLEAAAHHDDGALNRVVLLTDGQANAGIVDPAVIAAHVRELAARGVSTSAYGIGRDYNEDLLESVADAGDGSYAFIASPDDLPALFDAELAGLGATFARGVRLRLSRARGVSLDAVLTDLPSARGLTLDDRLPDPAGAVHGLGGIAAEPGRWTWSQLPNLLHGRSREVVVRLRVAGAASAHARGDVPIADAVLSWIPSGSARRVGAVLDVLALPAVSAAEYDAMHDDADVTAAIAQQDVARGVREAALAAERGDIAGARVMLSQAQYSMPYYAGTAAHAADTAAFDRTMAFLDDGDAVSSAKEAKMAAYRRRRTD